MTAKKIRSAVNESTKLLGVPSAILGGAAIVFYLVNTAFVTQTEFDTRADHVDAEFRTTKATQDTMRAEQKAQGCYVRVLAKVPGYSLEQCALR